MSGKESRGPQQLQQLMQSRKHISWWRGFSAVDARLETDFSHWLSQRHQRSRIALFAMAAALIACAPLYGRLLLNGSGAGFEGAVLKMRLFEWLLAIPTCLMAVVHLWRNPDSGTATRFSLLASLAVFLTLLIIRRISAQIGGNIPVELVMVVPLVMASMGGVRNFMMLPTIVICALITLASELQTSEGPELARALLGLTIMTTLSIIATATLDRLTRAAWLDRAIVELTAMLDAVTGIPNRSWFNRDATDLMRQLQRHSAPIAVALVDLDHFKKLNDHHGHAAGDAALAAVGDLLIREFARRPQDLVARYGGEEFVLVLYDLTEKTARVVAERILEGIQTLRIVNSNAPLGRLTASMGIWQGVPDKGARIESLLKVADEALYRAKAAGRNRYELVKA